MEIAIPEGQGNTMEILMEALALLLGAGLGLGFSWLALTGVLSVMFRRQA
jgi:hypothetical protein